MRDLLKFYMLSSATFYDCINIIFMIILISYINLLNLSWILKCLCLRNMEHLRVFQIFTVYAYSVAGEVLNYRNLRSSSTLDLASLFLYTLRKHAYRNILKISPPKIESFQIKILIIFIFLLKT